MGQRRLGQVCHLEWLSNFERLPLRPFEGAGRNNGTWKLCPLLRQSAAPSTVIVGGTDGKGIDQLRRFRNSVDGQHEEGNDYWKITCASHRERLEACLKYFPVSPARISTYGALLKYTLRHSTVLQTKRQRRFLLRNTSSPRTARENTACAADIHPPAQLTLTGKTL